MSDQLSKVFAALADPTRRDMVARLAVGDATVGELAEPYDVSLQAVSKHIQMLVRAGRRKRIGEAILALKFEANHLANTNAAAVVANPREWLLGARVTQQV